MSATYRPEIALRTFPGLPEFTDPTVLDDAAFVLALVGSCASLGAAMAVLAPTFVEYRGAVLLAFQGELSDRSRAAVDSWFESLGDVAAVERMCNHVHLWDLLPYSDSSPGDEVAYERLVEPLACSGNLALRARFPEREFVVEAVRDGGYGPEVTF